KVNHKASKSGSENRADDMEQHTAVESLIGWIKRECIDRLQSATSWPEMHRVLLERGLRIHERGNGLIITSENGVSVKASSVSRDLSKARLEARFGAFDAAPETVLSMQAAKRYDKRPIPSRIDTADLYARYTLSQQQAKDARATEWANARDRKRRMIEDAKRNGRLKRAAIKLIDGPPLAKKILYASTSKSLRDNIAAVNRKYVHERQEIFAKHQGRAWADWLQKEARSGDQQALAVLRARRPAAGHTGNTVSGQAGTSSPSPAGHDSVTKEGTVIHRVAACSIRDDGNKLTVSRGASRAGLEAALRMAIVRYGQRIAVTGSEVFKDQILYAAIASNLPIIFDDAALERRHQQLTQASTQKENKHANQSRSNGRPTDRSRHGGGVRPRAGYGRDDYAYSTRGTPHAKPHAGFAREEAPPAARHGLRELSTLGVVHVADRREMLLPGHVPGHVERQGTKSDHGLRRDLRGPGRLKTTGTTSLPTPGSIRGVPHMAAGSETLAPAAIKAAVKRAGTAPPPASQARLRRLSQLGAIVVDGVESDPVPPRQTPNVAITNRSPLGNPDQAAAEMVAIASAQAMHKYIIEREQKRLKGFDIPKHKPFTFTHAVTAVYAGIRRV
ncbi:MAG TPA: TraI/MobA(P) family conjugative relaxase, partial [Sphingomicrobium sp.]